MVNKEPVQMPFFATKSNVDDTGMNPLPMLSSAVERPRPTQTRPNLDTLANAPGDGDKERAPVNGKRRKALSEHPCEEKPTAKKAKIDCTKKK